MTNFFNSNKVQSFSKKDVKEKIELFRKINLKVFNGLENPKLMELLLILLESQEEALNYLFFGKRKDNVDKK